MGESVVNIMDNKSHYKKVIYIFIITMIMEVFLFNYKYWESRFYEVITPSVNLSDGTKLQYGVPYCIGDGLTLNITSIDCKVNNIYLGIDNIYINQKHISEYSKEVNDVMTATISISDDGNSSLYYVTNGMVSSLYPSSQYINIEAFGNTHDIQMNISGSKNKYVIFNQITLNEKECFNFNILRVIFIYFTLLVIYSFAFGKYEECDYSIMNVKYKSFLVFIGTTIIMLLLMSLVREQPQASVLNYQDLAEAITEGRFWVAENTDSVLASMDNPYSAADRQLLGANFYYDTAYYNGYYYIYFGITPVILFFLPYYLITGQHLTYYMAESIILTIVILCSFILVDLLRKRIASKLPWKISMLLSVIMATLSGSILFVKRVQIYYTAIATALMLIMIGLCLWLNSMYYYNNKKKKSFILYGMLGSLSMALAVGARPQFAMASFLAFAIFADLFKDIKKYWKKILLLLVPYIPVAAILMWYNYARFGSPFDFGANYNMTGYDMTNMGIHISRIPTGIWYYLFNLPRLHVEFPYIIADNVFTSYPGFMVSEPQIGGTLALLPICWVSAILLSKRYRKQIETENNISYKNNILMCYICAGCTLVIVIADTVMCGILTRYQMDYRIYIILASIIIIMMMGNSFKYDEKMYRIVACLGFVTLLFGLFTITAQYENPDYSVPLGYETSIYLKIRNIFGF